MCVQRRDVWRVHDTSERLQSHSKSVHPAFPTLPFPRPTPDIIPGGPPLSHPEALVQTTRRRAEGAAGVVGKAWPRRGHA